MKLLAILPLFFSGLLSAQTVNPGPPVWSISPPIETLIDRGDGTPFGNLSSGGGPAGLFNGYLRQTLNGGGTAFVSSQAGYAGKAFASPKAITKATVYGPTDRGYANHPAVVNVTLSLYGKVGAPSNGTDGTLLASTTFAQNYANESGARVLTSSDQVTKYSHVWVRVDGGSGISTQMSQIILHENYSGPGNAYLGYVRPAFIGDSIFAQMGLAGQPPPFNSATNHAVGGASLGGAAGSNNIVGQVSAISAGATHVIVEGGINNLPPYESMILPGYTAIFNSIPADKKIIVVGILHLDEAQLNISHPGWLSANYSNAKIDAVNAQINALAANYPNVIVCTLCQSMSMTGKTSDGIHPLASAYPEILSKLPLP